MPASRRLFLRLPLLVALAAGAWLWQSSYFPQERELLLHLPPQRVPLVRAELQISAEGGGQLLKRQEQFFQEGVAPPSVLREEISLRRGRYLLRVFLRDASGAEQQLSRPWEIGDERRYELELRAPPRPVQE